MARRTTNWTFADATERDTYVAGSGVLDGDTCTLVSDRSEHYYNGSAWRPSGGTIGQQSLVAPAGTPTVNVDWAVSPNARIDSGAITGQSTLTFANPVAGMHYTLLVYNGPGPGFGFNFPANVKFAGGKTPIADPTGIYLMYYDGTDYWVIADEINLL